jgi:2-phosphoglycerate kinase
VKRAGRPLVICLAGAPGVGKSTIATRLAIRLGINRVITTDAIREVLRTVIPPAVSPELHVSTYEGIDEPAARTAPLDCYRRQSRAVSAATVAVASRLAKEGRSMILEGVHIRPGRVRRELEAQGLDAIVVEVLLLLEDADDHRSRLVRRSKHEPARRGERSIAKFAVIRRLQDELRRTAAAEAGVIEHDVSHPEDLTRTIVDRIVARVAEPADMTGAWR